jgi:small conductance mechanosensitive channel
MNFLILEKTFFEGIKIFGIFLSALLFNRFLKLIVRKYLEEKIKISKEGQRKRIKTLLSAIEGSLKLIVWCLAILMILSEFGINIGPILASLGLTGFAIGMAARDILADFISGIFIILEDQYQVGDRIKIGNLEGNVVEFNLRRTIIKDEEGNLHLIPNSQIKIVSKKILKK